MLWQQMRARSWILALAVLALLCAKWHTPAKPVAFAERPLQSSTGEPLRAAYKTPRLMPSDDRNGARSLTTPSTFAQMEESADRPAIQRVGDTLERPAITGIQHSPAHRPYSQVIREPAELVAPAMQRSPIAKRYAQNQSLPANLPQERTVDNPINYYQTESAATEIELAPAQTVTPLPAEALTPHTSRLNTNRLIDRAPAGPEMKPVNQLARQHVERGFSLGDRNALYSARVEFLQALRIISQAVDAHNGLAPNDLESCSQALSRALQAIREADDFAPAGSHLDGDLDLAQLVSAHRTPICKASPPVTQMAALQAYFDYARQEFVTAAAGNPIASQALTGLGKCFVIDAREASQRLSTAKSMVYQQAALGTDGSNHLAANELGVLLGKYGQWSEAKQVFLQAVRVREDAAAWQNLAVVHKQLGEDDLARLAIGESNRLRSAGSANMAMGVDGSPTVQWVNPQAFSGPPDENQPVKNAGTVATKPKTAATTTSPWWMPWR